MRVLLFFLLILLFPAICAFAYESGAFLLANADRYLTSWFTYGFLLYVLIHMIVMRSPSENRVRRIDFFETFGHELAHTIALFMSLGKPAQFNVDIQPESIRATGRSGFVQPDKPLCLSEPFINLAPYWLPVFTIPFLVARFLVSPSTYDGVLDFLIGFTLAFHYVGLGKVLQRNPSDMTKIGMAFSLFITFILNAILLVIVSGIVFNNHTGIVAYFQDSIARSKDAYDAALLFLKRSWLSD